MSENDLLMRSDQYRQLSTIYGALAEGEEDLIEGIGNLNVDKVCLGI